MCRVMIRSLSVGLACLWPLAAAAPVAVPAEVESAFRRYVALPDQLVAVLDKARDRDSAEAAAAELQGLLPAVYDARREMAQIPELSAEVSAEVRRRYEKDMRTRWGKVLDHIYRLNRERCYGSAAFTKQFEVFCLLLEK